MRKLIFILLVTFSLAGTRAQNISHPSQIGDTFIIAQPDAKDFEHINFPRANFIIKRGGIANIKSVIGNKVQITGLKENKDGTTDVILKRVDGKNFYRKFPAVTANLERALEGGELLRSANF